MAASIKRLFVAAIIFLFILSWVAPALACTVFAASDGKSALAGNNEDCESPRRCWQR